MNRRTVLRGLGACISLPLLDAMLPTSCAAPSKFQPLSSSVGPQSRIIFCYVPNGVNIFEWMPESSGKDYQPSPTLSVLQDFQQDFSVLTGLGHPAAKGGHSGADTWLTGADLQANGSDYANTVSVDQVIAEQLGKYTRFPSLQLSDQSGTGSAGHSHTLSFDRSGTPLPAEDSPKRLFERLFVPDSGADRQATLLRYAQKKSVLDSVLDDANSLQRKLGPKDNQKLDEYFTSVRQTEQRLERLESWIDVPKPNVSDKDLQLGSQPRNAHDRMMWLDVMLELSYLTFVTDTSRVITFEWSREASGYGGGGENHHEFSHHGGDSDMLEKLGQIDRFFLERLHRFLSFLKSTQDAGDAMLDRTIVVYGSGMNSGKGGEHSPRNLPLLVAGGQKLGLQHGQHLAFDVNQSPPLSNLFVTLANKLDLEIDRFQDSSGTLTGMES
ncbi:MAG: DUF1552 domain-containing protein [Pirellulaceae bacterium]